MSSMADQQQQQSVDQPCSDIWCWLNAAQQLRSSASSDDIVIVTNRSTSGSPSSAAVAEAASMSAMSGPPASSSSSSSSLYEMMMSLTLASADDNGTAAFDDFDLHQLHQLLVARRQLNLTSPTSVDGFKMAVDALNLYATPVVIAVGVIGNALSLAVFSLTHLRRLSSSFYLSTLSVADIVFLLALIVVWLQRVDVDLFARDGWCQSVQYATRVSEFLAAWYVVSFTAERYVTVYYPLRKDSYCTRRRARIIVSLLAALAFVIHLPTFWTHDAVLMKGFRPACMPLPGFEYFVSALTGMELLASCLLPSITVVVLNVRIIAKIHRYQQVTLDAARVASHFTAAAAAHAVQPPVVAALRANVPGSAAARRRSMVQTSVSASGSMHIKFTTSKMAATLGNHLQPPSMLPVQLNHHYQLNKRLSSVSHHHQVDQQQQRQAIVMTSPHRRVCDDVRVRYDGGVVLTAGRPTVVTQQPSCAAVKRRLVRGQSQLRTARMLLVLSSIIILLNFPTHVFRVQAIIHSLTGGLAKAHPDRFAWQELFQLVQFTNFAVNFFVYSLCGRQFRTGLMRLCARQKMRLDRCAEQLVLCACCCCCCRRSSSSSRRHRRRAGRNRPAAKRCCRKEDWIAGDVIDGVATLGRLSCCSRQQQQQQQKPNT